MVDLIFNTNRYLYVFSDNYRLESANYNFEEITKIGGIILSKKFRSTPFKDKSQS